MSYLYSDVKLKGSILNGCIYDFSMTAKNSTLQRESELFGYIVGDQIRSYNFFLISNL